MVTVLNPKPDGKIEFKQNDFVLRVTHARPLSQQEVDAVTATVCKQLARTPLKANVQLPLEGNGLAEELSLLASALGQLCSH